MIVNSRMLILRYGNEEVIGEEKYEIENFNQEKERIFNGVANGYVIDSLVENDKMFSVDFVVRNAVFRIELNIEKTEKK